MRHDLTPLQVCLRLIGPYQVLSDICGQSEKAAYNWAHPSSTRDGGDLTSFRAARALLAHSDTHALGLTADHLIRGAGEAEVAAILAARQAPAQFTSARSAA